MSGLSIVLTTMTNMKRMFYSSFMILRGIYFLILLFNSCNAIVVDDYFSYIGDVSFKDSNNTLSEISLFLDLGKKEFFRCFGHCLEDKNCNAVEKCSLDGRHICRLSKGWRDVTHMITGQTCKRYMMVRL